MIGSQEVDYDELTREQLIVACQSHGLATGGKRMDMVGALKQWAWYLQNIQKITMESEDARWLQEVQDEGGLYSFGNNQRGQVGTAASLMLAATMVAIIPTDVCCVIHAARAW